MGTSTNAEISFGICFAESFEFPWDDEDGDGNMEQWWRDVNGFKHSIEPYDENDEFKPGWSREDPRYDAYITEIVDWDRANPMPVELVNYQHCDCPAYILAIPALTQTVYRGSPEPVGENTLTPQPDAVNTLLNFCAKYGISLATEAEDDDDYGSKCVDPVPKWWLSSYWG